MFKYPVSCWLSALAVTLLVLAAAACNRFDECNSDNDCGAGFKCVKGESAGVVSAACVPTNAPEDAVLLPELLDDVDVDPDTPNVCGYACSAEVKGKVACTATGVVCKLDCFGNCDGYLENGCEIDLQVDPAHCGGCDNDCAKELATVGAWGICDGGTCKAQGCNEGWVDLGKDLSDGCSFEVVEVGTTTLSTEPSIEVGHIERHDALLSFAERALRTTNQQVLAMPSLGDPIVEIRPSRNNDGTEVSSLRHAVNPDGLHLLAVAAGKRPRFLTYTDANGFVEYDTLGLPTNISAKPLSVAVTGTATDPSDGKGEFFSLDDDNVLRWYTLQPDTFDGTGALGCGTASADSLKLCLNRESDLAIAVPSLGVGVSINAGQGPAGTQIVWLSGETGFAEFHVQTSPATAAQIPMQVAPVPASFVPSKAIELEPYDSDGLASFAVLTETGVEFVDYAVVPNSSPSRTRLGGFEFGAPINRAKVNDLVPLDDGRFVIVANEGLYFFSALNGSDLTYLAPNGTDDLWLFGAYADGVLDVGRQNVVHHFELRPPSN